MHRVQITLEILIFLVVGILLVVIGILLFNTPTGTSVDEGNFRWAAGWLALFIGVPFCLLAGLIAVSSRPWRSQQASTQEAGGRSRGTMQKTLIGALIGFFAGPLPVFLVVTTAMSTRPNENAAALGFLASPYGTVPGLAIGALIGGIVGSRPKE